MRGVKAKLARRVTYGDKSPRVREYRARIHFHKLTTDPKAALAGVHVPLKSKTDGSVAFAPFSIEDATRRAYAHCKKRVRRSRFSPFDWIGLEGAVELYAAQVRIP